MQGWISVEERLPEKHVWVLVLEDDNVEWKDLLQRRFVSASGGWKEPVAIRVTPARFLESKVSSDGHLWTDWYLRSRNENRGPVRNVTHWKPIEEAPESTEHSRKLEERLRKRDMDHPHWDK